jgi:2',3'-cyclic-nucleotide 2'-phosphodiesterase (5'-nucleotidase family)
MMLLLALLLPFSLSAKETVVYHTSDTHGFYFAQENRETGELKGGFAALAAVLKKGPQSYLLLDSGDFSNGTIEAKKSKGLKSIQLMNAVGYHASTIGNHEFDFKDKLNEKTKKYPLQTMLESMNFPILAANFFNPDGKTYPVNVQPYKIFNVDGVKIAVIGLANITPTNKTSRYTFTDPFATLEQILPEVEKANPQAVLVIAHDGLVDDKHGTNSYLPEIHRKLAGRVHVVFGGHVHKIVNKTIDGVLYVESGTQVQQVSKVIITTDDETGKFVSAKDEVIPLDVKTVGQDPDILKLADSLREPGMEDVIGYTSLALSEKPNQPGALDNPLDNWLSDMYYKYVQKISSQQPNTEGKQDTINKALDQAVRRSHMENAIDVFVMNTGASRTDMPKGKITRRDLIGLFPHDNDITRIPMKGKDLATIVKGGIMATVSNGVVQ